MDNQEYSNYKLLANLEELYGQITDETSNKEQLLDAFQDVYYSLKQTAYSYGIYVDDKLFHLCNINITSSENDKKNQAIKEFDEMCNKPVKMVGKYYILKAIGYTFSDRDQSKDKVIKKQKIG